MAKIKINGVVGWDVWTEDVVRKIEEATGDLTVEISSEGGFVTDGLVIYNALKAYDKGQVNVVINGLAMSIASYIAMAGDTVEAYDNSIFMIHNAWSGIGGDHHALRKQADHLEAITAMMSEKYIHRTGMSSEEIRALMDEETYYYGDEIRAAGFADSTIATSEEKDKEAARSKAADLFAKADAKLQPKACEDADKACALLTKNGLMKQFENKPTNVIAQEEIVDELLKRLKALEDKAQRTEEDNKEMAKLHTEIDKKREEELNTLKKDKAELARVNEINELAIHYGADEKLHARYKKEGDPTDFVKAILDAKIKERPVHQVDVEGTQNRDQMILAMGDAIAMRAGATIDKPHEDAHMFSDASLLAIARKISGASEFASNHEVAQRVLAMGTSDFPILLSNVANKVLEAAWEEEPTTYQNWCGEADVPDFKENTFVHLGGFGNLQNLYELGEKKIGKVTESAEKGKIGSKGLIVSLSREAIINDDLSGFTRTVQALTQAGRRTLNTDVYSVLTGTSYKMSDNKSIFHADHGNLAGSGTAITDAALTAGELAMMAQTGLNGATLNLSPYYIITGPAKYREAKQLLANMSVPGAENNSGIVNTWKGDLTQLKDGNISGNQWYLAARNNTVKVMFLAGTGRRPIIEESDRSIAKGVEFTIVFDYGIMVDNYRTMYKNPGA